MDRKRLEKLAEALALAGFEIVSFEPSRTSTTQVIVVLEPVTDSAKSNRKAIFSGRD